MIVVPTPTEITRAAEALRSGALVAFPTETVYGLGADALNEGAVRRIFEVKGRPATNPLIVHLPSIDEIRRVAVVDSALIERRLERLARFWPGPLSVILRKAAAVPSVVSAGGETVAVRIPRHPVALALLRAVRAPVAAPSANRSTYVSPTTALHVEEEFGDRVSFILDGGGCEVGIESTVLSLLGDSPTLLRPGALTREILEEALDERVAAPRNAPSSTEPLLAPGLHKLHYAPRTPCKLLHDVDLDALPPKSGLITFRNPPPSHRALFHSISVLSAERNLIEAASRLFAALRDLDRLGLDLLVLETCEEKGIGVAIMDRLRRAAAGR